MDGVALEQCMHEGFINNVINPDTAIKMVMEKQR